MVFRFHIAATIVVFLCSLTALKGQHINCVIKDTFKNEWVQNAEVTIDKPEQIHHSGMNGVAAFHLNEFGTFTGSVQAPEYETSTFEVVLTTANPNITVEIFLTPKIAAMQGATVRAIINKESDGYARDIERESESILNVLSGKSIQLQPDITVGNTLLRVSGVSMERSSSGGGKYAIIRGMAQRYNYTLINGIKIPSPDNKFRYVPMDLFPSELLERLEVIKTLTPEMEADAIGGAVNLEMKSAPEKFTLQTNIGTGISQLILDRGFTSFNKNTLPFHSPAELNGSNYVATPYDFTYNNFKYTTQGAAPNAIFGISAGNRFGTNKKLGIMLGFSYQSIHKNTNGVFFQQNTQPNPNNVPAFDDILLRQYSTTQKRVGMHSKIDYKINKNNSISLYNVFIRMNETQYRHTIDTSLSIGRTGSGTGNTYIYWRSRYQTQSIYNSTLQGKHQITEKFSVNWSAVYSIATNALPDWAEFATVQKVGIDSTGKQYQIEPQRLNTSSFNRIWWRNTDRDVSGYLNLHYKTKILGHKTHFAAGGMYRDKYRNNFYNSY